MAGLGSDSRPQNPQANNRQSFVLNKGKLVEVSSDEDGFRGAWYLATVVDSPPKSVSKKRKKVMVEYKTLVKDDFTPLLEPVDPAHVRPLPPDDSNRVFRENDVVDAGYRDGWWTGIVRKVLEDSRYRVYFDNPPDVMDFDGKDLRTHWEWVNGNWVSSEKQDFRQTTGSIFSSGTEVEVNIETENARDAWFPAVVIKENEDGTFLVKYQSSGNGDEAGTKVAVGSCHIRPIPPCYADRNYELLEKVDVPYNSGWRAGLITKLLAGRRYNVFFKQGNEDKEYNHSEIRPHAEWVDGQWICKSKEVLIASDNEKKFDSAHNSAGKPEMSLKLESNGAANGKTEQKAPCSTSTSIKNLLEQSTHRNENSSSHVLPPSKKVKLAAPNSPNSFSRPSNKPAEEGFLDVPVTDTPSSLMKMSTETPVETLHGMTSPRTYGKRSRKTPLGNDPAVAQTESPLGGKRTVAPRADKILIRIKELPEKNMQQKSLVLHRQKLDMVTKRGKSTRSPFGSSQVAARNANTTSHINKSEDKKEAGTPLVIALEARVAERPGEEKLKIMRNQKKSLNDLVGGKFVGLNQKTHVGSSQRRKRGRPRKLVIRKASGTDKDDGNQDVADKSVLGEQAINLVEVPIQKAVACTVSQVALRERATEVSEKDCTTNEVDMATPAVPTDVEDEDQPLSMWIGGMHSSANAEDSRLSSAKPEKRRRDLDREMVPYVNEASGDDGTPDGNQCLPFVKSSMVWKTIESMEVFQIAPQNPHFQPLADCKEAYREGSAIGVMVTFATLFDKITSLEYDDSKSVLESTLESLVDLERHGFDVNMPRDRVNQLLSIKDGKEKLQSESKDAENQIKEHSDERRKLDANAKDIEKKIDELQKELAATKSKLENKDRDIARLQNHMDSVNAQINDARSRFQRVATAPWK